MRTMILIVSIAAAALVAAPAASAPESNGEAKTAPAADAAAPAAAAAAPADQEKKICKLLPSSGTRFRKQACLTDKEWKQLEAEAETDNGY